MYPAFHWRKLTICNTLTVGVHLSSTPSISGSGSATARSYSTELAEAVQIGTIQLVIYFKSIFIPLQIVAARWKIAISQDDEVMVIKKLWEAILKVIAYTVTDRNSVLQPQLEEAITMYPQIAEYLPWNVGNRTIMMTIESRRRRNTAVHTVTLICQH